MVRLIFCHLRGTKNRLLHSLELFVDSQPVVLLQEKSAMEWNSGKLTDWARQHTSELTHTEGTLSVRNGRQDPLPSGHFSSIPRLPHYTWSLHVTIRFLCFWTFTSVSGGTWGRGAEMWTRMPFYTHVSRAVELTITTSFVNLNNRHFIYLYIFWTIATLISKLVSVPEKKLGKVVRNRHASVLTYLCN